MEKLVTLGHYPQGRKEYDYYMWMDHLDKQRRIIRGLDENDGRRI